VRQAIANHTREILLPVPGSMLPHAFGGVSTRLHACTLVSHTGNRILDFTAVRTAFRDGPWHTFRKPQFEARQPSFPLYSFESFSFVANHRHHHSELIR
jgi:hypothetical protein